MNKLTFIALTMFLLFQGCSHYSPLQMGSGEPSGTHVKNCTVVLFGFPVNGKDVRLDKMMTMNNITSKDVFSIEREYWGYLFPLYANHCTIINLNNSENNITKGGDFKFSKPQTVGFDGAETIKECNMFQRLKKSRCRKYFYYQKKTNKGSNR